MHGNKQRKIIHVDMDCFYAAVEMRDNPDYRDIPLAVGGAADRRGVISTCNYIAREYGVHSAMATAYARRLCPDLTVIPGRMSYYKEISNQIRDIFRRYTDLIEPLSLDEAYLDVTEARPLSRQRDVDCRGNQGGNSCGTGLDCFRRYRTQQIYRQDLQRFEQT